MFACQTLINIDWSMPGKFIVEIRNKLLWFFFKTRMNGINVILETFYWWEFIYRSVKNFVRWIFNSFHSRFKNIHFKISENSCTLQSILNNHFKHCKNSTSRIEIQILVTVLLIINNIKESLVNQNWKGFSIEKLEIYQKAWFKRPKLLTF